MAGAKRQEAMMFRKGPRFKSRNEADIEIARFMDRLQRHIARIDRKIRNTRGLEQKVYERLWEELVCEHMEFEWLYHPSNPQNQDVIWSDHTMA